MTDFKCKLARELNKTLRCTIWDVLYSFLGHDKHNIVGRNYKYIYTLQIHTHAHACTCIHTHKGIYARIRMQNVKEAKRQRSDALCIKALGLQS